MESSQEEQQVRTTVAVMDRIMSSSNYYDVLGIQSVDTAAAIRKAYLTTSVLIHPDKCTHDARAKEAFQKVALAYQVLSDAESRANYDLVQAQEKKKKIQDRTTEDSYFTATSSSSSASRTPSYQDALFVFATVVGNTAGHSRGSTGAMMSDMAQTLYWAQQWLNTQETNDESIERGNDDTLRNSSNSTASAAMAVGSSLRVASSAARLLGFRNSATALERAGTATQMMGAGVVMADRMGVNDALENNESLQQVRSRLSRSVRNALLQKKHEQQEGVSN